MTTPQKPCVVFWGDVAQHDALVRLPPGMSVTGHVDGVTGVSPEHLDDNMLPHPPEWEHLSRHLPDEFATTNDAPRLTKDDVVVQVAAGLTESFVHELMEWLAVDGERSFNPHPVVNGISDTHWAWIGERLRDFYTDLLAEFPNKQEETP